MAYKDSKALSHHWNFLCTSSRLSHYKLTLHFSECNLLVRQERKVILVAVIIDMGLGGDPELEAAERTAMQEAQPSQEEASDEDEWTPKDAKDLAKKQRQMAKSGITFHSKVGPEAKVPQSIHPCFITRAQAWRHQLTARAHCVCISYLETVQNYVCLS